MNQLKPVVKMVRSIRKERSRSQVTGIQVITNLENVRTLNFRTTSSPLYDKTNDAINQSLTTIDLKLRPNPYPKTSLNSTTSDFLLRTTLGPKLALNSNSKPALKLPKQQGKETMKSENAVFEVGTWETKATQVVWPRLKLKTIMKMSISTIWDVIPYFVAPATVPWGKTADKFNVPNTSNIDSNLGVMLTSKTGNSIKYCPINPVAKQFQESSIEGRNSCQSEQRDRSNKVFWSSQSRKGGVCSTETYGGCYGAFSRRQLQKGNDQQSMHEQSALVRELLSKRVVCVEFDRRAENGKLEDEFSIFKTMQNEKEVIIVKNREGIGVGHEFKIKKTKYFLDSKEVGEDTVWFWSLTDHSKLKRRLLHEFQAAGLNMSDKNSCIQGNGDEFVSEQNYGSGRLAESHWTTTLVSEDNGDRKLTCKGSTSMALDCGDIVTGLLQFLYFFYPP